MIYKSHLHITYLHSRVHMSNFTTESCIYYSDDHFQKKQTVYRERIAKKKKNNHHHLGKIVKFSLCYQLLPILYASGKYISLFNTQLCNKTKKTQLKPRSLSLRCLDNIGHGHPSQYILYIFIPQCALL